MLPIFRPGPDAPLGLHGRALKGGLWRCLEVRSLSQGASGAVAGFSNVSLRIWVCPEAHLAVQIYIYMYDSEHAYRTLSQSNVAICGNGQFTMQFDDSHRFSHQNPHLGFPSQLMTRNGSRNQSWKWTIRPQHLLWNIPRCCICRCWNVECLGSCQGIQGLAYPYLEAFLGFCSFWCRLCPRHSLGKGEFYNNLGKS